MPKQVKNQKIEQFYLPPELQDRLRTTAFMQRTSKAQLIREGIEIVVDGTVERLTAELSTAKERISALECNIEDILEESK